MYRPPRKAATVLALIIFAAVFTAFGTWYPEIWHTWAPGLLGLILIEGWVHLFVWRDWFSQVEATIRNETHKVSRLSRSARKAGLAKIHCDRKAGKRDILDAMKNASERIWVIGITFTELVELQEVLKSIDSLLKRNPDAVRIMLLNPLGSPAVLRAMLESPVEVARKMTLDPRESGDNQYFHSTLFLDSDGACAQLSRTPLLAEHGLVRFYRHYPTSWMIIADTTVFYQPYLLGSLRTEKIGEKMPVLQFDKLVSSTAFYAMLDDFEKKWATTDIDLFHMQSWLANRTEILGRVLDKRRDWLNAAFARIHEKDRRKSVRQNCNQDLEIIGSSILSGFTFKAKIVDYSAGGMQLEVDQNRCPGMEDKFQFSFVNAKPNSFLHDLLKEKLLESQAGSVVYSVVRQNETKTRIGLRRVGEAERISAEKWAKWIDEARDREWGPPVAKGQEIGQAKKAGADEEIETDSGLTQRL